MKLHATSYPKIVFFGTPEFAVAVLNELKKVGIIPTLIITAPDKPKGRKLVLNPPPVKVWAQQNGVEFLQPQKLDSAFAKKLQAKSYKLFIIASYGKIIPKEILGLPKHGTLNVHPSLLPKFRGPSPVQSAILEDERETGVTIMLVDEEIDHGPTVAQKSVAVENWPPKANVLKKILAYEGGRLLAEIIPQWIKGKITPEEQDHNKATYTKIIKKEDGLIDLNDSPYENFKKIQAFDEWPGAYFFTKRNNKKIRVKITDAFFKDDVLTIQKVTPEGKGEMDYRDFLRGTNNTK